MNSGNSQRREGWEGGRHRGCRGSWERGAQGSIGPVFLCGRRPVLPLPGAPAPRGGPLLCKPEPPVNRNLPGLLPGEGLLRALLLCPGKPAGRGLCHHGVYMGLLWALEPDRISPAHVGTEEEGWVLGKVTAIERLACRVPSMFPSPPPPPDFWPLEVSPQQSSVRKDSESHRTWPLCWAAETQTGRMIWNSV